MSGSHDSGSAAGYRVATEKVARNLSLSPALARVHQDFDHAAPVALSFRPHHDISPPLVAQILDEQVGGSFDGQPHRWLAGEKHPRGGQIDRNLVIPGHQEIRFAIAVEIALDVRQNTFEHDAVAHIDLVGEATYPIR